MKQAPKLLRGGATPHPSADRGTTCAAVTRDRGVFERHRSGPEQHINQRPGERREKSCVREETGEVLVKVLLLLVLVGDGVFFRLKRGKTATVRRKRM
ncbi:hypothetical protein FQA47_010377 [Oryzias melastigma]|uniref:Uncharacterized protein n=1 Tax=Oryzias melastigma TaxID=30732 RepID=A0A834CIC8_ORYME|nr:hypothetical protein FQA47_010377 [Oryzias melastigma]